MSGGTFNHNDFYINDISRAIEEAIENNDGQYTPETIERFAQAVDLLQRASIFVHRIDYLLAGDDGEDTFHQRLAKDMEKHKKWEGENIGLKANSPEFKEILKTVEPWDGPLPGGWRENT